MADFKTRVEEVLEGYNLINPVTINKGLVFDSTSIITPPTLTAAVNNYDPVGMRDVDGNIQVSILRVSSNGGIDQIRGIVPSSTPKGDVLIVVNVEASGSVRLMNNNASSDAANRLLIDSNITLGPNDSVMMFYDLVDSRWRKIADYR